MTQNIGYLIDLAGLSFAESGPTWIQALPLGTYKHPIWEDIKITPERVARFAENVNNNVRGTELDIDYEHKLSSGEAAGWVKAAEARSDGLWISVDWTTTARKKLKEKEYRYFSPEFTDEWIHPKTSVKFKDVLFGGGLTNRPFLKDILPINLSEVFADAQNHSQGGAVMDEAQRKALAKKLGLPETATEAEIHAAAAKEPEPPKEQEPPKNDPPKENEPPKQDAPPAPELVSAQLSELMAQNPAVKALFEQNQKMAERVNSLETSNKLSEAVIKIGQLDTTKAHLSPAVKELARDLLVALPTQLSEKLTDLLGKIVDGSAVVQLTEEGHSRTEGESAKDGVKVFTEAINKKMKDAKLSYSDAVSAVALEEPKLYENYLIDSYDAPEGR